MRKGICVPMMALCLLLTACGGAGESTAERLREPYSEMAGCAMEAVVTCGQAGLEWEAVLRCDYVPGGEAVVEVLSPESIAGVRAVFNGEDGSLEFQGEVLNAGRLSAQGLSPAACLPQLMSALREGWLLEENEEDWNGIPCLRLGVDQTGGNGGKIASTVWLRLDDGTPLRGEIAVEGEIILAADFTSFTFYDTLEPS